MRDITCAFARLAVAAGLLLANAPAYAQYDTYIRSIAFEMPGNEYVLLRWPENKMPLRVYLTAPPAGLFEDPDSIHEAVRKGILGWTDVAKRGVPSFKFVDSIGDADIPIVWAKEPDGNWYIAHCAYDIQPFVRRFGVSRILVTGRWQDRVADSDTIYRVVLHEMGHALGLGGHSEEPEDIMFGSINGLARGLSERDRDTLKELYSRPIGSRITAAKRGRPN